MRFFDTIKLYKEDLYKFNENVRLNKEVRGTSVVPADLRKLGEKYTFENKVQMQIETGKMVEKLDIYYQSLVENIDSNTFNDFESSWMTETKEEFDKQFDELKEHVQYLNLDLQGHIKEIYEGETFQPS